jgi:hypothetical protein
MGAGSTKKFRGQDQVFQGSPTGEPIVITRFDYLNACGTLKYYGEAKICSEEIDCKWHIECYENDSYGNITAIKTAINQITTKASTITVDTTSNPGFTRLELSGGTFFPGYLNINDRIKLETGTNSFRRVPVEQILSDTEILISQTAIDETNTPISDEDLIITLEAETTKDYHRRRWDLREYYLYK